jgi:alkaline phosphatase
VVENDSATDESGTGISTEDGPFPVRGDSRTFTLDWTTTNHTAVDVPVTAVGPLAHRLTGKHPHTWLHRVFADILLGRR